MPLNFTRSIVFFLSALLLAACVQKIAAPEGEIAGEKRLPNDRNLVSFDPFQSMSRINNVRSQHFLAGLRMDPRLMQAAKNHAEYMGKTGKFGHEFGPETRFQRRIYATGFQNSAGENIGVGYRSIEAAIDGWMNSPGHRKILLKRNYSLGGIAYAPNVSGKNPQYNHFWVLIVGKE